MVWNDVCSGSRFSVDRTNEGVSCVPFESDIEEVCGVVHFFVNCELWETVL